MNPPSASVAPSGMFSLDRIERGLLLLLFLHVTGFIWSLLDIALGSFGEIESVNIMQAMLWLAFYVMSLAALFWRYGGDWIAWLVRERFILCLAITVAVVSVFWSIAPGLTMLRAAHLVGTTIVAIYVGYHYSIDTIWRCLALALVLNVVLGTIVSLALPDHGQMIYQGSEVWRGLQGHKNGFAAISAICFLMFFIRFLHSRPYRWMGLALCGICLLNIWMADSKTALIGTFLAAGVVLLLRYGGRSRISTAGVLVFLTGIAMLGLFIFAVASNFPVWDLGTWTTLTGRSANLSGRTEIWSAAWEATLRKPLLGYGYGTVWFPREELEYVQSNLLGTYWTAFHGHNGFLQIAPEVGLPVAVATIAFVAIAVKESLAAYFSEPGTFPLFVIAFEIAFIARSFSEANLLLGRSFEWLLFIALSTCIIRSQITLTSRVGPNWSSPPERLAFRDRLTK